MVELTQAELDALDAELAELRGPKRAEAVAAIAHARGFGDLSENFEYHAAKDAQGLLERQITILEEKRRNAVLISADRDTGGSAAVGSTVTIEEDGDKQTLVISNGGGPSTISPDSPLGRALIGATPGETVTVQAPGGEWTARVVSVK
jgi:transcription elongation factor GreA